jgi:hypothetical protein
MNNQMIVKPNKDEELTPSGAPLRLRQSLNFIQHSSYFIFDKFTLQIGERRHKIKFNGTDCRHWSWVGRV